MFTNRAKNGANNLCGKTIARYRTELGKSQRELADLLQIAGLDIDKNAIQRIEAGKRLSPTLRLYFSQKFSAAHPTIC